MTFLWGKLLWLLLTIPVLVGIYFLLLRRKKKTAVRYASLSTVKDALSRGAGIRRHIPPVLFLLAITVMIVAIARPAAVVTLPSERGTVILAMDVSGSMRATDVLPSRLVASQEAARTFVEAQPKNVRIGVVAFSGTAAVVQGPTTNKEDVLAAIGRFHAQRGTAVGSGILTSLMTIFPNLQFDLGQTYDRRRGGAFGGGSFGGAPLGQAQPENSTSMPPPVEPGSYKQAIIILLTDGQTTTGPDPIQAADQAANLGVRIYTVGLGTTNGVILGFAGRSMRVQLDEATLRTIADRTHGQYFHADSSTNLRNIYKSLSTKLVMETTKTEITALFTAIAALLALVASSLSLLWFSRLM